MVTAGNAPVGTTSAAGICLAGRHSSMPAATAAAARRPRAARFARGPWHRPCPIAAAWRGCGRGVAVGGIVAERCLCLRLRCHLRLHGQQLRLQLRHEAAHVGRGCTRKRRGRLHEARAILALARTLGSLRGLSESKPKPLPHPSACPGNLCGHGAPVPLALPHLTPSGLHGIRNTHPPNIRCSIPGRACCAGPRVPRCALQWLRMAVRCVWGAPEWWQGRGGRGCRPCRWAPDRQ